MYTSTQLDEYMDEIRQQVCSKCIERPPGAPPCAPHGKRCGIELHLAEIVEVAHSTRSQSMDPYIENFHNNVCSHCAIRSTSQCPCPLDYLLLLAIQAIETVDERTAQEPNAQRSSRRSPLSLEIREPDVLHDLDMPVSR